MTSKPLAPDASQILASISTPVQVFDRQMRYVYVNEAFHSVFGKTLQELKGKTFDQAYPETEDRIEQVRNQFRRAFAGEWIGPELQPYRIVSPDGQIMDRYWRVQISTLRDADGTITHLVQTAEDVTDAVAWRRQRDVISSELEHRIRNTLAMVGSLAMVTGKSSPDIETFIDTFTSRLEAMSRSLMMISNNHWEGLTYRQIVCAEIAQVLPPDDPRIQLEGPEVRLSVRSSKWVALLAHEAVTNAVRYGCFSVPDGRLSLRWWVKEGRFITEWQEFGPCPSSPPTREGFGTKMMSMMPNTTMRREFRPEGFYLYTDSILNFINPDHDVTNQSLLEALPSAQGPHE